MNCRHCRAPLQHTFLDLGFAPPSNAYLSRDDLARPETTYPLKLLVCARCWLVQTEDYAAAEALFGEDYAYFSSVSSTWLEHARRYAGMITARLGLNADSLVLELAANDGYLLRNFLAAGIPCLGIEPTASTAARAEEQGIPVLREFFTQELGAQLASQGKQADLIIGNNVYAHVPDINDFTLGMQAALKPNGTITLEFPHLLQLIQLCQFDTVYHEHYSYLSLFAVRRIFERAELRVFHVERLATHGGSLRVYGCHAGDPREDSAEVTALLREEEDFGLRRLDLYLGFQSRAEAVKNDFLLFLLEQKKAGRSVFAYGAAAKGNTLLNFAGVMPDLLPRVFDAAPSKQGKYLPGSHIPIRPPVELMSEHPDFVVILPWNIKSEVMGVLAPLRAAGTRFVTAVPALAVE